jgi:6-phosphogluconolactonase
VTFAVEVLGPHGFAEAAAARIAVALPGEGSVVLTGGTTAEPVYAALATSDAGWGSLDVYFSDERCVPPDDGASNYGMVKRVLLDAVGGPAAHRMRGEIDPQDAARHYDSEVRGAARAGFDLVLLGMGADCHIAGMFPGSPALEEPYRLCVAVRRPDGVEGLTLTPPALAAAKRILLLAAGGAKAEAVRRAVRGTEAPEACPARVLSRHRDVTFLLDESAGARL